MNCRSSADDVLLARPEEELQHVPGGQALLVEQPSRRCLWLGAPNSGAAAKHGVSWSPVVRRLAPGHQVSMDRAKCGAIKTHMCTRAFSIRAHLHKLRAEVVPVLL